MMSSRFLLPGTIIDTLNSDRIINGGKRMSKIVYTHEFENGQRLEIARGDITEEQVDAIVNAANSSLAHGGGVAGAILRKGGDVIQTESTAWVRQHGKVSHEEPAYTSAGRLPARYVIHAVGPAWGDGDEDHKLANAIRGSLATAEKLELTSIAFPAISTGIFGFPVERAARIFRDTIHAYFIRNPHTRLNLVRITLWDEETVMVFLKEFKFDETMSRE
jgi:O-acetyl-ADP-ribose deacetylase (regulator of RNase III)